MRHLIKEYPLFEETLERAFNGEYSDETIVAMIMYAVTRNNQTSIETNLYPYFEMLYDNPVTSEMVMNEVKNTFANILNVCYSLDINPCGKLRKRFEEMNWTIETMPWKRMVQLFPKEKNIYDSEIVTCYFRNMFPGYIDLNGHAVIVKPWIEGEGEK